MIPIETLPAQTFSTASRSHRNMPRLVGFEVVWLLTGIVHRRVRSTRARVISGAHGFADVGGNREGASWRRVISWFWNKKLHSVLLFFVLVVLVTEETIEGVALFISWLFMNSRNIFLYPWTYHRGHKCCRNRKRTTFIAIYTIRAKFSLRTFSPRMLLGRSRSERGLTITSLHKLAPPVLKLKSHSGIPIRPGPFCGLFEVIRTSRKKKIVAKIFHWSKRIEKNRELQNK